MNSRAITDSVRHYLSLVSRDVATAYLALPRAVPTPAEEALDSAIRWIRAAQDAAGDGGVARSYSLAYNRFFGKTGWTASYPETTGYIIPTVFDYARQTGRDELFARAVRMADWECDVQMPGGAVQGGTIDAPPSPAIFNTGQVIFGWVRAYHETQRARYLEAAVRAGDFLVSAQSADGAWRKDLSRFASQRIPSYTYNTRTAWALAVLADASGDDKYRRAAVRNVEFALGEQQPNGWFRNNCLANPDRPLLHTIAYAIRGILEVGIATGTDRFVAAARTAAEALLVRQRPDGSIAGCFDAQWSPAVPWNCLTGNAQIGLIWGRLHQLRPDPRCANGLAKACHFLRRIQWRGTGNPGLDGGISGSHPLHGAYGSFEILNWAVKFFADALMLDASVAAASPSRALGEDAGEPVAAARH